ncbi:MAG: ComEC/Rec2 family competence protein [Planctomycetota bacterium]|jgi:beta-lactamase superfamily II metal-dependent hydrolase
MYAHFIDVGQGDATVLEFPCGVVLIDAGAQDVAHANGLINYLDDFFASRPDVNNTLESIIVTHNHIDHTKALRRVVERYNVKRYIDNGQRHGPGTGNPNWVKRVADSRNIVVREILNSAVTAGGNRDGLTDDDIDPIDCNGCDPNIVILWARLSENPGWSHSEFDNKNNQSLVIRVDFGGSSFLFTGDLEDYAIERLLEYYEDSNEVLDVDVYQAGHHGSVNATTAGLVEWMTPEIAVISVGDWDYGRGTNNRFTTWHFGHPRKEVVDLLSVSMRKRRSRAITMRVAEGARDFSDYRVRKKIYSTASDGTVKIRATLGGRFRVTRNN